MSRTTKFIIIFSAAIVLFVALSAFLSRYDAKQGYPHSLHLAGKTLSLRLAITESEKEIGLSGVSSLSEDQAMLFFFDTPGKYGFWMKDMNIPIDILWLDQHRVVVHIEHSASPGTYPAVFTPKADASYVLETAAGFSKKNNVRLGEKAEFLY